MSQARVLNRSPIRIRRILVFGLAIVAVAVSAAAQREAKAADRIALRDARVIADRTVVGFDEDGVRLDGAKAPTVLGWDEIESATVAPRDQPRFNAMLKDLGEPLFRLRSRLKTGDSRDYGPFAETLYPRLIGRKSATAQMTSLAVMRARLASGRREAALGPYLRSLELVRAKIAAPPNSGPPLRCHPVTGFCDELPAVWFDAQAAKAALPSVREAIAAMTRPVPEGVFIYAAALALTAGDEPSADAWLKQARSDDRAIRTGLKIVQAQREALAGRAGPAMESLTADAESIPNIEKPAAYYWIGRGLTSRAQPRERLQGVLLLLRLPAQYGEQAPDLAAAGLHQAALALEADGDASGAATLRNELLVHYGNSYHAARLDPKRQTPDNAPAPAPAQPQRKG